MSDNEIQEQMQNIEQNGGRTIETLHRKFDVMFIYLTSTEKRVDKVECRQDEAEKRAEVTEKKIDKVYTIAATAASIGGAIIGAAAWVVSLFKGN